MDSEDRAIKDETSAASSAVSAAEERISVASNLQLVWWRFRKHRLAVISGILLLFFIAITLVPEFFAVVDPEKTSASQAFIPSQRIHLWGGPDGGPWVPALVGERDQVTRKMEWKTDDTQRIAVRFFARGFPYRVLGLIPSDVHLIGLANPTEKSQLFLMGTDRLGRDSWSRLMYGTRISMTIGLVSVILSMFLGLLLGGISGYFGGAIDMIIQRLIEVLQSLPTIPIWLALSAALPRDWPPTKVFFAITVILSLLGWTGLGREVRGRFLSLREEDFVLSAELLGASRWRIIMKHMVPTMTSHIIAISTLSIPAMIINETSLSFLGLGLRPPAISWGVLLQEAQNIQTVAQAPWLLIPGVVVIIVVLAFNLIGDGLRDAADPYAQ